MAEAFTNNLPPSRSVGDIIAQGYALRTFEYLREGWKAFVEDPVGFLGFALALTFASQALPLLAPFVGQLLSLAKTNPPRGAISFLTGRRPRKCFSSPSWGSSSLPWGLSYW